MIYFYCVLLPFHFESLKVWVKTTADLSRSLEKKELFHITPETKQDTAFLTHCILLERHLRTIRIEIIILSAMISVLKNGNSYKTKLK